MRRSWRVGEVAAEGSRLTVLLGDCAVEVGEEDELGRSQSVDIKTQHGRTHLRVGLHGGEVRGSVLNTHLVCSGGSMEAKGTASDYAGQKLLIEGLSEPSELPRRRPNGAIRRPLGRDHARHAWPGRDRIERRRFGRTTESIFPSSRTAERRRAARDKHAAVAPACPALTKSQCSDNSTLDSTDWTRRRPVSKMVAAPAVTMHRLSAVLELAEMARGQEAPGLL